LFQDGPNAVDQIVSIPLPDPGVDPDSSTPGGDAGGPRLLPLFIGPENRLVEVAVGSVLESPGAEYNPMLLVGEPGVGKSHLAYGLAAAYQARYPRRSVVCQPAIDFAREWADAMETQATERFRRRYDAARLVVLDDVTRLAGNDHAQAALVSLIDTAVAANHQVVATACSPAGRWARVSSALQSRLEAGLSVPRAPPGEDARRAILLHTAAQRGLPLSESAARILAEGLSGSVRELLGSLARLQAARQMNGAPIDVDAARAYVAQRRAGASIKLKDIAAAAARVFSLPVGQLRGRSQRQEVVSARGTAMYLARQLTESTLEEIGRYFGGRDHTTVLHQCQKTARLLDSEPAVERMIEQVEEILHTRRSSASGLGITCR